MQEEVISGSTKQITRGLKRCSRWSQDGDECKVQSINRDSHEFKFLKIIFDNRSRFDEFKFGVWMMMMISMGRTWSIRFKFKT